MKVGLVLGAGGVLGGAWLTGGLNALARETSWDPGSADFIVGTSAGSMVGALRGRRRAAVVHGRPLARRDLQRRARRRRPSRRRGRPRRRGGVPGASGSPGPRPGLPAHDGHRALEPAPPPAAHACRRLATGGGDLHRLAQGRGAPGGARALGRPPQLLGRHVRLRQRQARALRQRRRAGGGHRRRRRRLVCHPRLLPPGAASAAAATWTAASARRRTSTCSPGAGSTS